MQKTKVGFLIMIALIVVGITSCKKKEIEDNSKYYWAKAFFAGNFTLNNQDVPIYNDASTNSQTANFFLKSETPAGDIDEISLKWYIPTDTTLYTITFSDPYAEILVSAAEQEMPTTVAFLNNVMLDSIQYSIYNIIATLPANTVNKDNLENVKFKLHIKYTDNAGTVINRPITSNIYKKDH